MIKQISFPVSMESSKTPWVAIVVIAIVIIGIIFTAYSVYKKKQQASDKKE